MRLVPAKHVKRATTDFIDAEACQRPTMRFVPLKPEEQLTMQSLHRLRQQP